MAKTKVDIESLSFAEIQALAKANDPTPAKAPVVTMASKFSTPSDKWSNNPVVEQIMIERYGTFKDFIANGGK